MKYMIRYNAASELISHYKYTYDGQGNIVRSIDMMAGKEYDIVVNESEFVISKVLVKSTTTTQLVRQITIVWEIVWEKGRQLKAFDSNTYTYNSNGIRTSKIVNGVKHTYQAIMQECESNGLFPFHLY